MAVSQLLYFVERKVDFEYPATVRFRCIKCGICCGDTKEKIRHILLLPSEAEQIAKVTLQPISKFAVKIKGRVPYSYEIKKRAEDGKCVFLENSLCKIYSLRPLICKFYPFELKISKSRKYTFFFTEECLGINRGGKLREDYFRKLFRLAHAEHSRTADSDI